MNEEYVTGNNKMDKLIANALEKEKPNRYLQELELMQDNDNPNKYHVSRKEERQKDNITFQSKMEMLDYQDLKNRQKAGEIFDLQIQVPIEIIPNFKRGAEHYKGVWYVADAMWKDKDGKVWIQDTKGVRTKDFIIKKKLIMYYHPEYIFIESFRKDWGDL